MGKRRLFHAIFGLSALVALAFTGCDNPAGGGGTKLPDSKGKNELGGKMWGDGTYWKTEFAANGTYTSSYFDDDADKWVVEASGSYVWDSTVTPPRVTLYPERVFSGISKKLVAKAEWKAGILEEWRKMTPAERIEEKAPATEAEARTGIDEWAEEVFGPQKYTYAKSGAGVELREVLESSGTNELAGKTGAFEGYEDRKVEFASNGTYQEFHKQMVWDDDANEGEGGYVYDDNWELSESGQYFWDSAKKTVTLDNGYYTNRYSYTISGSTVTLSH